MLCPSHQDLRSPFESVVQLEDAAAEGPEHGYNRGMHWWLGGRLQVTPASGWDEERRSWEVASWFPTAGLTDTYSFGKFTTKFSEM